MPHNKKNSEPLLFLARIFQQTTLCFKDENRARFNDLNLKKQQQCDVKILKNSYPRFKMPNTDHINDIT